MSDMTAVRVYRTCNCFDARASEYYEKGGIVDASFPEYIEDYRLSDPNKRRMISGNKLHVQCENGNAFDPFVFHVFCPFCGARYPHIDELTYNERGELVYRPKEAVHGTV